MLAKNQDRVKSNKEDVRQLASTFGHFKCSHLRFKEKKLNNC